MKLFGIPIFVSMTKDMEDLYTQVSRKRFRPFLRVCLLGAGIIDVTSFTWDYFDDGVITFLDLRIVMILFYFSLLGLTFIPKCLPFIHSIGVAAITGAIFSIATLAAATPDGLERFLSVFFIPLQLIPVMTSFFAALATIWISVVIIFDLAEKSHAAPEMLEAIRGVIVYYVFISAGISYVAAQYRRAAFLMEKNLEQARKDAEAANEAKSMFLATMSHEVRTPLNGILGLITLIKDTPLSDQQRDYVETIRYSGETLLTILNDILDFSKMEAGKFDIEDVQFNLERLISSVVTLMQSRAQEKGIGFSYKLNGDIPSHIRSDPTRLRQVLLNLVNNAIKFTDSGFVQIAVSCAHNDGKNALLHFEVSDTGIGIPEDSQSRLFQEFAQADSSISRKYGGTGLGLAICKKIVELMRGKIGVISQPDLGSIFWFDIPAEIAESAGDPADMGESTAGSIPAFKPVRVLVAEDNAVNQKVISGLLERSGLVPAIAANGEDAVQMLTGPTKEYDLVLMDMQMPVMDGIAATIKLRETPGPHRDVPVIALTANTVKGDEQRCLAAGMNGFVAKPIDPATLYKVIAQHLPKAVAPGQSHRTLAPRHRTDATYEHLSKIERMMGRDYMIEFAEDGLLEIEKLMAGLHGSQSTADMRRSAHDLKSLSDMLGLPDVQALAEGIELCCIENSMTEARVLGGLLDARFRDNAGALRNNYLSAI